MPPLLPPASPKGTSSPSCRLPCPGRAQASGLGAQAMPGRCEDRRGVQAATAPDPPRVRRGRCQCSSWCRRPWQPRGWGRAAQRGRGGGGTPPPRLFFSRCGRHTPLPAPAAPVLPAPAAIIRRAAGGPGGAEPSLGGQGTLRGSSLGRWGCAGHLSFRRAASQAVRGWCWGGILRSTPRPGGCRHGAIPARVEGEPVQAAAGRGRACPGRASTPSAGEIPCLLCAFKGAGSSL